MAFTAECAHANTQSCRRVSPARCGVLQVWLQDRRRQRIHPPRTRSRSHLTLHGVRADGQQADAGRAAVKSPRLARPRDPPEGAIEGVGRLRVRLTCPLRPSRRRRSSLAGPGASGYELFMKDKMPALPASQRASSARRSSRTSGGCAMSETAASWAPAHVWRRLAPGGARSSWAASRATGQSLRFLLSRVPILLSSGPSSGLCGQPAVPPGAFGV